jgi:hypothetical protein
MDFVYLDESGDVIYTEKKGTRNFVLSALIIPEETWNDVFKVIKAFRSWLRKDFDVPMYKELHARDFLNGRGRPSKTKTINKYERIKITHRFFEVFSRFVKERGVYSINVCVPNQPGVNNYDIAVDRMLNRIQRTLKKKNRQAILIFDEGKEQLVRRLSRKMRVYNPIPSQYGTWENGNRTKNITTDRILADPFFRNSADDYFIQVVDFIAFSVLKHFEPPTEHVSKYEINKLFKLLEPILYKEATKYHPLGVVTK